MIALLLFILIMVFITTESQAESAQVAPEMREICFDSKEVIQEVEPPEIEKYNARISFYCNCPTCCGKWYTPEAIGKAGIPLVEGIHCAASANIPLGAVVEIDGLGTYVVADRVAPHIYEKYGTTIDVFMGVDHEKAFQMGVMERQVTIIDKTKS